MAELDNTFKVVTPDDVGSTIVLGLTESNKYDVDFSKFTIPEIVTGISLSDTTLRVSTIHGEKTVDLASILPEIVVDTALSNIALNDNKLQLTVSGKGKNSTVVEVDVSDLLPVKSDGKSISGDGTEKNKLAVRIFEGDDNLIEMSSDGLKVSKAAVQALATPINPRDIKLVNAAGTTTLGYIYSTEN